MFDGTDLSMAYGTSLGGGAGTFGNALGGAGGASFGAPEETQGFLLAGNGANVQMPPPPQNTSTESIVLPPPAEAATSHAIPPDTPYYPPQAMYAKGGSPRTSVAPGDSMWDKMGNRKYDVLKLVVLSLVILLAMSSDRVIQHYLSKYITGGLFTNTQEFFVRLSYPLIVLLLLWWLKAISS